MFLLNFEQGKFHVAVRAAESLRPERLSFRGAVGYTAKCGCVCHQYRVCADVPDHFSACDRNGCRH